jgi:uncharacterized phiE125 gp8 family phage protein
MALIRLTAPTVTPLTLAEVKKHLRVVDTDEDDIIAIYLKAATDWADGEWGFLGRALVTQTWRLTIDEFPDAEIKIPLPPLQSVTQVVYDDPAGVAQVVNTADYYVDTDSEPGWVVPIANVSWPTPLDAVNAVRIDFVAGYPPSTDSPPDLAANIPFNIKAGLLLVIANMYENRETDVVGTIASKLPFGAETLLRRHKIDKSMA